MLVRLGPDEARRRGARARIGESLAGRFDGLYAGKPPMAALRCMCLAPGLVLFAGLFGAWARDVAPTGRARRIVFVYDDEDSPAGADRSMCGMGMNRFGRN